MINNLPSILITGASGFIGRYLLKELKNRYYIFALARRSSIEAHVPIHPNIQWIQWDISNTKRLEEVREYLDQQGVCDYVLHLAGFYDFDYKNKPEYYLTNVLGTRNVLELSRKLRIKRFIFASSVAACDFSGNGVLNEKSPANADYAYARTKKQGEDLTKDYSRHFKCSIVRFAAVFSDWCEYAPLYNFLSTWLSNKWNSKIIGGRGNSAITYLHIHDLYNLILKIITKDRFLPQFDTYLASPDSPASHKELFRISTHDYFGEARKAFFVPKILAATGILSLDYLSYAKLIPKPFEKPWMIRYIDKCLRVDSSYTRKMLGWQPIPRYHLTRRLLFLLVNLKSHPEEWKVKNEASLHLKMKRTNLLIYERLSSDKELLINRILATLKNPPKNNGFTRYRYLDMHVLLSQVNTFYNLILASVRSGDRSLMIKYGENIALEYYLYGFQLDELLMVLNTIDSIITNQLGLDEKLSKNKQEIHDYVGLSIQLAKDAFEDYFEEFEKSIPHKKGAEMMKEPDIEKSEKLILKLSSPYQTYSGDGDEEQKQRKTKDYSIYDMR